ncbi:MAG: two-component sensor histidine kinase [Rhodospirillales bacterium]|nr:two-component sensor histidine kinase [Rhodospirillales bacterium]
MRRPNFLATSTFRLALLYAVLFGASVLVLLGVFYWGAERALQRQTSQAIEAEIQALQERYRSAGVGGLTQAIVERAQRPRLSDMLYLLATPNGQALAGNMTAWPEQVRREDGWLLFAIERRWQTGETERSEARARSFELPQGLLLLVGRDNRERVSLRRFMLEALAWSMAAIVLLGIAGGLLLSRRVLSRIDAVARVAEEIRRGDVSSRVALSGTGDEFDRLAETLNRMLDEIERLVASIRGVTVNIAHDLKSPLARLRGRLEMTLRADAPPAERSAAIEQAIEEADGLIATFNALLSIAEAQSGRSNAEMAELDLAALVEDASDLYEPLAEEREVRLEIRAQPGACVTGNRQLLFQALANLIDNALKYAPSGGTVRVWAARSGDGPELGVADQGPGIPEVDRGRVLEPFVRLDQSRGTPGSGLGLSLVDAIARLHGAVLRLEDNGPGLTARLVFTRAGGAAAAAVAPAP